MGQQRGKKEIILETSPINLWGTIFGNLKTLITRNRNLLKLANFFFDVKKKTITNWPKLHVPLQLLTVRVIFDHFQDLKHIIVNKITEGAQSSFSYQEKK